MSKEAKIVIAIIAILLVVAAVVAVNVFSRNNSTLEEGNKVEESTTKTEEENKDEESTLRPEEENKDEESTPKSEEENETEENTSNLNINNSDDLTALVDKIYEGVSIEMPMLMTMPVDTADADAVKAFTGLDSAENIEYAVASEPMMSSQAYSMVLVKVKNAVEADTIAREINKKIDERKWICVTAEKIYTVASGDIVCLVMSNEDTAKTVFESFKTLAGTVGQVYERTAEEAELPEDMLPGQDGLAY